jgi:hypothetical protein
MEYEKRCKKERDKVWKEELGVLSWLSSELLD